MVCCKFGCDILIFVPIVQEAVTVNDKLEKQHRHHQCVVLSYQDELASTKKELLRVTTELSIIKQTNTSSNSTITHAKNLEHQLKMVNNGVLV